MSEPIPEDVMQRAEVAYHRQLLRYDREDGIAIVARALMEERLAERERCAKIAAAHSENASLKKVGYLTAISIAAAIRGQP